MKILKKVKSENGERKIYFCGIKILSYTKSSYLKDLKHFENILYTHNMYYFNKFDIWWLKQGGLTELYARPNFDAEFNSLTKNLPQESVDTLIKIVNRINMVKDLKNYIDLFSNEEKIVLRELEQYKQEVIKLAENKYQYKSYLLPVNAFEESVFFFKHGIDKIDNLDYVKDKDIIDVGGYIGDSALILSPLTNKKIYSFEATSVNYKLMQRTIKLNNLKNVEAVQTALGFKKGKFEIQLNQGGSSLRMKENTNLNTEICEVITLDEFVKDNNIEVGLIKVDIEGFEQEFIKGALETIKTQKPIMLLSIYHNAEDFLKIKPMIEDLNLGYRFKIIKPTLRSICVDTVLLCEVF